MKVCLAVSGSISCYKSIELVRTLIKNNHQVRVVLTKGAEKMLKKELFEYLGCEAVYSSHDDFKVKGDKAHNHILHISLARWMDLLVVYPMSANLLARMVHGMADDLLTSLFLAKEKQKPVMAFPAMNTQMWESYQVQRNLKELKNIPCTDIIEPDSDILACGEMGKGKLPSVETAYACLESWSFGSATEKALITTGATLSPLDPIRYLTNGSTGSTGYELAKVFLSRGYKVHLVATLSSTSKIENLRKHPNFSYIRVEGPSDMAKAVEAEFQSCSVYISSAAVGDIEFKTQEKKLKKSKISKQGLATIASIDILKQVLTKRKKEQLIIGFAAETDLTLEMLEEKFQRKPVDLLIGNTVSNQTSSESAQGFGHNIAPEYKLFESGKVTYSGQMQKAQLATYIANWVVKKKSNENT